MDANEDHNKVTCKFCKKIFSKKSNLTAHINIIHPTETKVPQPKFLCHKCSLTFNYKSNLIRHITRCKPNENGDSKNIKCILCGSYRGTKSDLLQHYSSQHDIDVSVEKLEFDTFPQFEAWKEQVEKDTISKYARLFSKVSKTSTRYYYRCHRDGFYKTEGKDIRRLKLLGSNKINGYCPAKIQAKLSKESLKVSVEFLSSHVGHTMDLKRVPLKKSGRDLLASKMSQKIPFDELIKDVKDDIQEDDFDRKQLLTKKNLFNIKQLYNLNDESVRLANDSNSLESWINEMTANGTHSVVRFYKKQGSVNEDYQHLKLEDFLLIIMNDAQLEVLKKFGNNCVCADSIHSDFKLTTLMVLDDLFQGFPCMLVFSNREGVNVYKVVFDILKKNLNGYQLTPKVFMSDVVETFYSAWLEVMGPVERRLFCSWHVNEAWKKNLTAKIKNTEKRTALYKVLRTLLEEREEVAFERMLKTCLNNFESDEDFKDFGIYFKNYYGTNPRAWACCYRRHADSSTDRYLARMHRTLKSTYVKEKSVCRLDETISAMMKMVQHKLFKTLIIVQEGKLASKLYELRKMHKTATKSATEENSFLAGQDGGWTVCSPNGTQVYEIEVQNETCTCDLKCSKCFACIHTYTCSCPDSSIGWNMCKHIHLLCIFLKTTNKIIIEPAQDLVENNSDSNLIVYENSDSQNWEEVMLKLLSDSIRVGSDIE